MTTVERKPEYLFNRIHMLFEMVMRRPNPTNVPIYCLHEPTTGCNLKCPACPTGIGKANVHETADTADYETVLREFGTYLDTYYLFNWGEPTMSRNLIAILKLLKDQPFQVNVSSNFSVPLKDDVIDALAAMSNLNLRINVDGATQESHQKYRINSKLSTIFNNSGRLAKAIQASGTTPSVYFGFLAFPYNAHEYPEVKKMAAQFGFGSFKFDDPLVAGEPQPIAQVDINPAFGCTWLYSSILPTPGLSHIAPCCGVWDGEMMSKRLEGQSLHETFMNEPRYMFRRAQDALFATQPKADRDAAHKANLLDDDGMGLQQKDSKVDICNRCAMGKAYQNKLPQLTKWAYTGFSGLMKTDLETATVRINRALNQLVPGQTDLALRETLTKALDMPPAPSRTLKHYEPFFRFLEQLH